MPSGLPNMGGRSRGSTSPTVGLEKARRLARARGVDVQWVAADLLSYEPPSHAFELSAILYLQLPAEQRRQVVRAAAGAVAPGGTFLLVAHDLANIEHGHGGPQNPTVLFTAEDIVADLDGTRVADRASRARRAARPDRGR